MSDGRDMLVMLDPRHPLHGLTVMIHPLSGATTYTEGRVRFTSPEAEAVRAALADLRAALEATRGR